MTIFYIITIVTNTTLYIVTTETMNYVPFTSAWVHLWF